MNKRYIRYINTYKYTYKYIRYSHVFPHFVHVCFCSCILFRTDNEFGSGNRPQGIEWMRIREQIQYHTDQSKPTCLCHSCKNLRLSTSGWSVRVNLGQPLSKMCFSFWPSSCLAILPQAGTYKHLGLTYGSKVLSNGIELLSLNTALRYADPVDFDTSKGYFTRKAATVGLSAPWMDSFGIDMDW